MSCCGLIEGDKTETQTVGGRRDETRRDEANQTQTRLRLRPEDSSTGSGKGDSREGQVKKTPVEGGAKKTPEMVQRKKVEKFVGSIYVFEKWVERCKKCIACQRRYFEKMTVIAPAQNSD
jgi:hypothetical protein